MSLESVVNIADLVATNPTMSDAKSQGDDHIRNIKTALLNDFAGFTGAVMVTGTDGGAVNAYTLTPAHALVAYGTKMIAIFAPTVTNTGPVTLNISGLGAKSVYSVSGVALVAGDLLANMAYAAVYDGTKFLLLSVTQNYVDQLAFSTSLPAQPGTTTPAFLRSVGGSASFGEMGIKGTNIASAATINLTTATGDFVHVTGTTPITGITIPVGAERTVIFDGALTLTHSAALLLPGAANITTAANDRMIVRGDTAGATVVSYVKATGKAIVAQTLNCTVITSTGTWTPPAGVLTAEITVIDGGDSCNTHTSNNSSGGRGGRASISTIAVNPAVTYTATVGAGGVAGAAGTITPSASGGASSFSGSGIATLTSTTGTVNFPSGDPLAQGSGPTTSGGTLFSPTMVSITGSGLGAGGPGVYAGFAGNSGNAGAIIIKY